MSELRFGGRVAIVTGAGRGLGRSHASLLASKGARVVVVDPGGDIAGDGASRAPADEVVEEIRAAGGEAVACHASVAEEAGATAIVETALDAFGQIDIVVNNAGIHDPGLFDELSLDQFRRMLDVHFFGTLLVTRAAWPHLVRAGQAHIVNTVSEAMLGGLPRLTSYGAAKGAVYGLTRNLASEGLELGIRANAIAPRAHTRMSASSFDALAEFFSMSKETLEQINAGMPPDLCSPAVAFLAHESCPLNGEVLLVGMGGVQRVAMVRTQGIREPALTAEDIAAQIDTILDIEGADLFDPVEMKI